MLPNQRIVLARPLQRPEVSGPIKSLPLTVGSHFVSQGGQNQKQREPQGALAQTAVQFDPSPPIGHL